MARWDVNVHRRRLLIDTTDLELPFLIDRYKSLFDDAHELQANGVRGAQTPALREQALGLTSKPCFEDKFYFTSTRRR